MRIDRRLRLSVFVAGAALSAIEIPLWGAACAAMATLLDIAASPIERALLRRRSAGLYAGLCLTYLVAMAFAVVPVALLTLSNELALFFSGYTAIWVILIHCIIVRTDKIGVVAFSVAPVVLVFMLAQGALVAMVHPRFRVLLILMSLALFGYLVRAIYGAVLQKQQLVEAQRQTHAANATKDRFFAAISHELRTPLNGILGVAQLLERDARTPDDREHAANLVESSKVLQALLNDLLDHSKLVAGQFTVAPESVRIRHLFTTIVDLFAGSAAQKGIGLHLEITDDVPEWVGVDPVRLRQIIANLLSNAIKFTDEGAVRGRVVSLRRHDTSWLRITIADEGAGIPADRLEAIFDPYVQLDDASARRGIGTGLGLMIARDLARLMGGDITVTSRPATGSTFTILLPAPVTQPAAPQTAPAAAHDGKKGLAGRVVVLADDNRINRVIARRFLDGTGAIVREARNGAEALAICRDGPVDAVLMDMDMPVMTGREALAAIRGEPALAGIFVILMSAADSGPAEGFDATLAKPLGRTDLLRVLAATGGRTADAASDAA